MRPVEAGAARIAVRSPEGEYPVLVGRGLLDRLGHLASSERLGRKVVVASDTTVAPLYSERVMLSLHSAGFDPSLASMPAGEANKTMSSVDGFIEQFVEAGLDRSGWVLALGGGVVGDTAGFAASIFMRGVPLVQAPTTLLSMADSSVGGKVGVDHPRGKNLLGAFKNPRLVVAGLETLSTLPAFEVACGMAEIIKAAVIGDPLLMQSIEESDPETLDVQGVLVRAIQVKRRIIEADPFEQGERAHLNLGHTFGHAFEKASDYSRPHGYAVAQGMVVAFRLARSLGLSSHDDEARLVEALKKWRLPVRWGALGLEDPGSFDRVIDSMATDKKRRDGRLRFVLPLRGGGVRVVDSVPESLVRVALEELQH